MISIKEFPPEIEISTTGSDSGSCLLLGASQRALLEWFRDHKPEMVKEVLGIDEILANLERQRAKAEQDYRSETDPHERQYHKSRNNTLYSVINYLRKELP